MQTHMKSTIRTTQKPHDHIRAGEGCERTSTTSPSQTAPTSMSRPSKWSMTPRRTRRRMPCLSDAPGAAEEAELTLVGPAGGAGPPSGEKREEERRRSWYTNGGAASRSRAGSTLRGYACERECWSRCMRGSEEFTPASGGIAPSRKAFTHRYAREMVQ